MKRSNIIPEYKKSDKQIVKNYHAISLLPIFGKTFEKIILNEIYNFLLEEGLLNPNQSGFRPSDAYINQLLSTTHEIFEAFDCNPPLEVGSVFLDISKVFDRVWQEGYKALYAQVYEYLRFVSSRFQSVVLNRQTTSWRPVLAGGLPSSNILNNQLLLISKWNYN